MLVQPQTHVLLFNWQDLRRCVMSWKRAQSPFVREGSSDLDPVTKRSSSVLVAPTCHTIYLPLQFDA
jgi:hypothetical protein